MGTLAFFLGSSLYGAVCIIEGHQCRETVDIKIKRHVDKYFNEPPEFLMNIIKENSSNENYYPSYVVAKKLGINGLALSKITSSMDVERTTSKSRVNIGLCLKFESKSKKVLGYSRKTDRGWEFSQNTVALLARYMVIFFNILAKIS